MCPRASPFPFFGALVATVDIAGMGSRDRYGWFRVNCEIGNLATQYISDGFSAVETVQETYRGFTINNLYIILFRSHGLSGGVGVVETFFCVPMASYL